MSENRKIIADSYEQLQSLKYIDEYFNKLLRYKDDTSRPITFGFAATELCLLNCCDLLKRQKYLYNLFLETQERDQPSYLYFYHIEWHRAILEFNHRFMIEINTLSVEYQRSNIKPPKDSGFNQYLTDRRETDSTIISCLSIEGEDISDSAIATASPYDLRVRLIHNVKNINLYFFRIATSYGDTPKTFWKNHNYESLYSAVFDQEISSPEDTYLSQFRLFHQCPELAARFCNEIIEHVVNDDVLKKDGVNGFTKCMADLSAISSILPLAIYPLLSFMTSGQYYRIRQHLGETSGSFSQSIVNQGLMKEKFKALLDYVNENSSQAKNCQGWHFFLKFVSNCREWRYLHMGFPRNLLGSHDTASLKGSLDAIKAASAMANWQFLKEKDFELNRVSPSIITDIGIPAIPYDDERLHKFIEWDKEILRTTALVTQREFDYVQNRARAKKND